MGLKRGVIGGAVVSAFLICLFAQLELDSSSKIIFQVLSLIFIPFFTYDGWKFDKEK